MTLFVTLLVIVLLFIALILYSRQKTADRNEGLELTSNLTAQINQTLLLSKAEPLLALKLAETLPGEARELALQLVASELYLAGHKTQARELYQQLPPHARDYVLNTLIETLLDSDDTQACLELLENWGGIPAQLAAAASAYPPGPWRTGAGPGRAGRTERPAPSGRP